MASQKLLPDHIKAMYNELLKELPSSTVHMIHSMLKLALDLAVEWKKIASNPCRNVNAPRREKKEILFLDLGQAQRLIISAENYCRCNF
jgi:integrase